MDIGLKDELIYRAKKVLSLSEAGSVSYDKFKTAVSSLYSPELNYPDTLVHISIHELGKIDEHARSVCRIVEETNFNKLFEVDNRFKKYEEDVYDLKNMCDKLKKEDIRKDISTMLEDLSRSFNNANIEERKRRSDDILLKSSIYKKIFDKSSSVYSGILQDITEEL